MTGVEVFQVDVRIGVTESLYQLTEDNIRHYNSVMWENYLMSCQIAGSNADMAILTLNFELVSYNHENEETVL